jgi:hypothetical protein
MARLDQPSINHTAQQGTPHRTAHSKMRQRKDVVRIPAQDREQHRLMRWQDNVQHQLAIQNILLNTSAKHPSKTHPPPPRLLVTCSCGPPPAQGQGRRLQPPACSVGRRPHPPNSRFHATCSCGPQLTLTSYIHSSLSVTWPVANMPNTAPPG